MEISTPLRGLNPPHYKVIMKLKPILANTALRGRQLLPPSHNRFDMFRNRDSSASSVRDRSSSAKRKASDGDASLSQQVKKKANTAAFNQPVVDTGKFEALNKKVGTLYNICARVKEEVIKLEGIPEVTSILNSICNFMDTTAAMHDEMVSSMFTTHLSKVSTQHTTPVIQVSQDTASEVSDSDMDTGHTSYSQVASRRPLRQKVLQQIKPVNSQPEVDPKVKKFQDAVKLAERSSLVFNLDMGNTKLLNEKSILEKATLSLTAKAAVVEGKPPNRPSTETVNALDDVLSIASGVTLFGKQTKVFRSKVKSDDPRNGTFFTIPVRYEFKDRDQKLAAESVLRERCKIECTTPYPTILRHCIRQVVEHIRADHPEEYIKVHVDAGKFCLKLARRAKNGTWYNYKDSIPLPEECYNTTARTIPEDLIVPNLPARTRRESSPPPQQNTE